MRSRLAVAAVACLLACNRRGARPRETPSDEDPVAALPPGTADAGPSAGCQVSARRSVLASPRGVADAGDAFVAPIEAARAVSLSAGRRALWIDAREQSLRLGAEGRGALASHALTAGERSDPVLTTMPGGALPAVVWVRDAPSGRLHVVRVGDNLDRGCRYTEQRDEGLALSAVPTSSGLLVAWDEEGPGRYAGSIHVQSVAAAALGAGARDEALPACPAAVQVTPLGHDASDPTLVALPDGAAVVLWLNARDINPNESNDAATNVWARLLDPRGQPVGAPLRLVSQPGRRFGVSASATDPSLLWVAFRASDETDSTSRDDGDVAVLRVERGPSGLLRASDVVRVNAPDGNPMGVPAIFARAPSLGGARVFWREREGGAVHTLQRVVAAARNGPLRALTLHRERVASGMLPTAVDRAGSYLVPRATATGGLDLTLLSCADER